MDYWAFAAAGCGLQVDIEVGFPGQFRASCGFKVEASSWLILAMVRNQLPQTNPETCSPTLRMDLHAQSHSNPPQKCYSPFRHGSKRVPGLRQTQHPHATNATMPCHASGADQDLTYYGTLEKPGTVLKGFGRRVLNPPQTKSGPRPSPEVIFGRIKLKQFGFHLLAHFFQVLPVHKHETSWNPIKDEVFFLQIWTCALWWFCQLPRGSLVQGRGFFLGHGSTMGW